MSNSEWVTALTLTAIFWLYSAMVWSEYERTRIIFSSLCGVFLLLAFTSHMVAV